MFDMWNLTVASDRASSAAMSRLVFPSATSLSTSSSRGVSAGVLPERSDAPITASSPRLRNALVMPLHSRHALTFSSCPYILVMPLPVSYTHLRAHEADAY